MAKLPKSLRLRELLVLAEVSAAAEYGRLLFGFYSYMLLFV